MHVVAVDVVHLLERRGQREPRLEDQEKLFALLDPGRIEVTLSEEFQLEPEQSTSAIIVHHPEAKYFSIE